MSIERLADAVLLGDLDLALELISGEPGLLTKPIPGDKAIRDSAGVSPLHLAVHTGRPSTVACLLDAGADMEARNESGRTPLHDSLEYGHPQVTRLLRERGAVVDICSAAILGLIPELQALVEASPPSVNDFSTQLSPLGWAAYGNQPEAARLLLDRGARMDDFELHCAAAVGHVNVGRVLVEAGFDVNAVDPRNGCAALHIAAALPYTHDSTLFVQFLLETGADPRKAAADGRTALSIARDKAAEQLRAAPEDPKNFAAVIALLERADESP